MRRIGFSLTELLVVMLVMVLLTALCIPVFLHVREQGRQTTCLSHQKQIAMTTMLDAQDRNGRFAPAEDFWSSLELDSRLLTCPASTDNAANDYVLNSLLPEMRVGQFTTPQCTMVSADGSHALDAYGQTREHFAYTTADLRARHQGRYVISYLDGHVELTKTPPDFTPPMLDEAVVWLRADRDVQYVQDNGKVTAWQDQTVQHLSATPVTPGSAPTFVPHVTQLGNQAALHFTPAAGENQLLHTPDLSALWTKTEGSLFVVFLPDCDEYSVLDQSNGDANQGSRVQQTSTAGPAAVLANGLAQSVFFSAPNEPTVNLSASANPVAAGSSVTLTWTSTNANSVQSSNFGASAVNGSKSVTVNSATTFTISVKKGSQTATASVTIYIIPTVTLSASPTTVTFGGSSTLTWFATNATSVTSSNFAAGAISGSKSVTVNATTTYTITVLGPGGQATASVTVTVIAPAPTAALTTTATTIIKGSSTTLNWTSTHATTVASSNFGAAGVSGTATVTPTTTTMYSITVQGAGGQATAVCTITVIGPPTVTLKASPDSAILLGQDVTLTWSSTDATAVASTNLGTTAVSGSTKVAPSVTTTYTITVKGPGGEATATCTINVGDEAVGIQLQANPTVIVSGQPVVLTWTSTGGKTVVKKESNYPAKDVNGTTTVYPTQTAVYFITVKKGNEEATATAAVTVLPTPPTVTLSANPSTITEGGTTTLVWTTTQATSIVSTNITSVAGMGLTGSKPLVPGASTLYSITVKGPAGQATATAMVNVVPQPDMTVNLDATPTTVHEGDSVTLKWTSKNASKVVESDHFKANSPAGMAIVQPKETTTYAIQVGRNNDPPVSAAVTVNVIPSPITLSLDASPRTVTQGTPVQLTWQSNGTGVATSSFGAGDPSGTLMLVPMQTTTYTMTVMKGVGQAKTANVTVNVRDSQSSGASGQLSWFRQQAAKQYPPCMPRNNPMLLSVVADKDSYTAYQNGTPWLAYGAGPDWLAPAQFYLGGSLHGTTLARRRFNGYLAEVIAFNRALTDEERRQVEFYLVNKYRLR